jgi:diguanylate cyclase (GGDEF)-like protein
VSTTGERTTTGSSWPLAYKAAGALPHAEPATQVELAARRKILLLLCGGTAVMWVPVGYALYLVSGSFVEGMIVAGSSLVWLAMFLVLFKKESAVNIVGWLALIMFAVILLRRLWLLYNQVILPDPNHIAVAPALLFLPNLLLAAYILVPPRNGLALAISIWGLVAAGATYLGLQMLEHTPDRPYLPAYWVYFFVALPVMILCMNVIRMYAKALINASDAMLLQQQQLGEMSQLAFNDYLTQLPNRRMFEQQLDDEWDRAVQRQHGIGIIFIDVDHFKSYNDLAGHASGDECLVDISRCLARGIAENGWLLARFGGEEFCILAADVEENALGLAAEKVRYEVAEAKLAHPDPRYRFVTVSVGAAIVAPGYDDDKRALLRRSDQALYQAKAAGRNQCIVSLDPQAKDIIAA